MRKPPRQLGLFDGIMLVMGGIVGAGIFANPSEVAHRVHTPFLILGVWVLGGLIALCGAFIWAELATRLPGAGGQYLYLREAYHPAVAFVYGWALLLVTQTGGMAAVAVTFSRYFVDLTHAPISDGAVAFLILAALTVINCLGVRAGSTTQNVLMVLKIGAVALLVACGYFLLPGSRAVLRPVLDRPASLGLMSAMGAAIVPVLFSYGGWQTSSFMSGELREPKRDLPRGLLIGTTAVIALYLSVNFIYVRALGAEGL